MSGYIWPIWTSTATCSVTRATEDRRFWETWLSGASTTGTHLVSWKLWVNDAQASTDRLVTARAEQTAKWEAERVARQQQAERAAGRARRLRDRHLLPEQREQLAQFGYFDLEVGSGRIYRIHGGTHGNVREMVRQPDGTLRAVASLCCQPEQVPEADAHLAQLLWLKHDEEQFRRIANIRNYDPQPYQAPARQRDLVVAPA